MNREEIKLKEQLTALQSKVEDLEKKFETYKKKSDKIIKTLENQLKVRTESVYRQLRKTQVIEKQRLTSLEQTVSNLGRRINK